MQGPINLDHNATTPVLPAVAAAMHEAQLRFPGNPASQHALGRDARRAVEDARRRIGELVGARVGGMDADRVVFTSGGTEANNLALRGLLGGNPRGADSKALDLLVSAIEHPSVAAAADALAAEGRSVARIGVDPTGVVRLEHLEQLLDRGPRLASVMLANNETGVVQPVAAAAALCRARGVLLHTDAVQAVGKVAVDFAALGVDALGIAPHKFHGPRGIGALVVRHGVKLAPQLFGGFQQGGERPGTESPALVLGMLAALESWHAESQVRRERLAALGATLVESLQSALGEITIVGAAAERAPHTLCVAFAGVDRQALALALDMAGVACSTGSACASGSSEPSPVLVAMGLPEEVISSAIRLSWGAATEPAEMVEAARRISLCVNRLRRR
ncbi:MAG: cysteine desulfurase [Pirellulales bacterium]|nr:cysteine desulfurase [Pirellulales bacterium]